jgi:hypothetical protein
MLKVLRNAVITIATLRDNWHDDVGLERMGFVRNLKLRLSPPRMTDPEFGNLIFMYISKFPERSYWECEWIFPPTGSPVAIALRGGETGPEQNSKQFYNSLPGRFPQIMSLCRPQLEQVFKQWLNQPLPENGFEVLKLSGFGLEDVAKQPVQWDVSFETTGEKWLGITIPFVGDIAGEAIVDT